MKRLVALVLFVFASLALGAGPAMAASHSGPEALAKGDGAVTTSSTQSTPIFRELCSFLYGCLGQFEVAQQVNVTTTEESFDFSAKRGPKTTADDTTDGAFGTMKLTYRSSVTTSVVAGAYYQFCNDGTFYAVPACPPLSGPTPAGEQNATATADVTCLNVVQNHASIGGHVTKFSGDFTPTRGMLFNATDNTIAKQQTAPDEFLGTFVTDVPATCPAPGADAPITSGDVYVKQG
jgi:hypothetical protein